jgi:hypothetical protein
MAIALSTLVATAPATARTRTTAPSATVTTARLAVSPSGGVQVPVRCADPRRSCRGDVRLLGGRDRRGHRDVLGRASIAIRPGATLQVTLRVTRATRARLQRSPSVAVLAVTRTVRSHAKATTRRRSLRLVRAAPAPPQAPAPGPGTTEPGPATPPPGVVDPTARPPVSRFPVLNRITMSGTSLTDSVTHRPFVSRGANYIRLATTASGGVYHSTFEPGTEPGRYNHAAAAAFLDRMRRDNYNTARVFIDPGGTDQGVIHGIGGVFAAGATVDTRYMDNVVDFVRLAAERSIYVVPVLEAFPSNKRYWDIVGTQDGGSDHSPNIGGEANLRYLDKGWLAAKVEYARNFAAALATHTGPAATSAILAYESDNEIFVDATQPPFDKASGTVTPSDGKAYNMAVPADRQQAADAALVQYSIQVKQALVDSDPAARLAMGFFTPAAVGRSGYAGMPDFCSTTCSPTVDYRYPGRPATVSVYGAADLIDLHVYPRSQPYDAAAELATTERDRFRRPFVIGEIGAIKAVYGNSISRAVTGMRDAERALCARGAQGYLYWTWDTFEQLADQDAFFKLSESSAAINATLAPAARPDPCR